MATGRRYIVTASLRHRVTSSPRHRMSRALRRFGIPLPLAHARDRDAREHAVLREGIAVRERLGLGAAAHVHDEQAADRLLAVVALRGAREHEDLLLALQVV